MILWSEKKKKKRLLKLDCGNHFMICIYIKASLCISYIFICGVYLSKADGAEGVAKNYADCDLDNNTADELFIDTTCNL